MNEIIKRCAKAVANCNDMKRLAKNNPEAYTAALGIVKTVFAAAREPTDAMLEAGEANLFEHLPEAKEWTLTHMRDAYQAMIGEVLK